MFPTLARVIDEQRKADLDVERKSYIVARIEKNPRSTNLYWQLVDPEFSLLELGFEFPSGRLVHCSVPLFNGEVESHEDETLPDAESGTPCFEISAWPLEVSEREIRGNHLKEKGRLKLLKMKDGISMVWKDDPIKKRINYAGTLICHFTAQNELGGLSLKGSFSI